MPRASFLLGFGALTEGFVAFLGEVWIAMAESPRFLGDGQRAGRGETKRGRSMRAKRNTPGGP